MTTSQMQIGYLEYCARDFIKFLCDYAITRNELETCYESRINLIFQITPKEESTFFDKMENRINYKIRGIDILKIMP